MLMPDEPAFVEVAIDDEFWIAFFKGDLPFISSNKKLLLNEDITKSKILFLKKSNSKNYT